MTTLADPIQSNTAAHEDEADLAISFEFFPPKTAEMETRLWDSITRLAPLAPRFVSVTYGADGSTRERTHGTVTRILNETSLTPAAHLTCVGAAREEIDEVARSYWETGVRHIVALRGDPPGGVHERYTPHEGGYAYAAELVAGLRRVADFDISVAAFPEVHHEAGSPQADLDNLKRKLDAGAERAITQFFFDPVVYLRFVERARAAGIEAPIVPGIFPISNFARTVDFATKCGASIPGWFADMFAGLDEDPQSRMAVAAAAAAEQCRYLQAYGVREFHFYTLNRAELTTAVCRLLRAPATPWTETADIRANQSAAV